MHAQLIRIRFGHQRETLHACRRVFVMVYFHVALQLDCILLQAFRTLYTLHIKNPTPYSPIISEREACQTPLLRRRAFKRRVFPEIIHSISPTSHSVGQTPNPTSASQQQWAELRVPTISSVRCDDLDLSGMNGGVDKSCAGVLASVDCVKGVFGIFDANISKRPACPQANQRAGRNSFN